MSESGYPFIARAGWPLTGLTLVASYLVNHYCGWLPALPLWLLVIFLIYIFRDPKREIPSLPMAILCPVDARVISAGHDRDPYLQRDCLCISLRVSAVGSYASRSPTEGNIIDRWFLDNVGNGNPGYGIHIRTDEGDDVTVELGRNRRWQTLLCYMQPGERIGQGQRCGYFRFGATVRVYVPDSSRIEVQAGDRLISGSSVLATLIH